jgi:hypothetical protein
MARSDDRNLAQRGGGRHVNSRDENQYFDPNARHYPVGEYGRDFVSNPDVPGRSGRYPVGDYGRDYEPHDLTGWQRARRSIGAGREQRQGSDYGNDPQRYPAGNYDQFADRYYANERRSFRGRGPKGYRRSDARIREDVCERLTDDDRVDASNIDVTVKDCEVTLTGSVSTREQKRRAETIIENLSGLKDVHNQLRVMEEGRSAQTGATSASSGQSSQREQTRPGARH